MPLTISSMEDSEKSLDMEGYSLLPDIVWNPISDIKNSQYGKVVFTDVKDVYPVGKDLICTYRLTDGVEYDDGDQLVIFCVGWTNIEDYVTLLPATKPEIPGCELSVTFSGSCLPEAGSKYYQFCYLKSGEICGASVPFNFVKHSNDSKARGPDFGEQFVLRPQMITQPSDISPFEVEKDQETAEAVVTKELESLEFSYHFQDSMSENNVDNDFETLSIQHKEIVKETEQAGDDHDTRSRLPLKDSLTELCGHFAKVYSEQKSNEANEHQIKSDCCELAQVGAGYTESYKPSASSLQFKNFTKECPELEESSNEMKMRQHISVLKKLLDEQIDRNQILRSILFETEERANDLVQEINNLRQQKNEEILALKTDLNELIDKSVTLCEIISKRNADIKVLSQKFLDLSARHIELQDKLIEMKSDANEVDGERVPDPVATTAFIPNHAESMTDVHQKQNICTCTKESEFYLPMMYELSTKMDLLTQLVEDKNKIEMESYELLCFKIAVLQNLEDVRTKKQTLLTEQERCHAELQNSVSGSNEGPIMEMIANIVKEIENLEEKTVNDVTTLSEIEQQQCLFLNKCLELKKRNNDLFQSITIFGNAENRTNVVKTALEETFQGIKLLDKKLDVLIAILSNAAPPRLINIVPTRVAVTDSLEEPSD